ncbi:MAG: hypothetical protein H0U76_08825 [Ktedonobacteraceae bacterium]|nr:hypothetical protein [Ktedonobacteraceae bacterium]
MEPGQTGEPSTPRATPTTIFRYKQRHPLNAIFEPKNIAVIGATEKLGSVGPRPSDPHLTILTNAGGPGVLATDTLVSEGGQLTTLSSQTLVTLDHVLH